MTVASEREAFSSMIHWLEDKDVESPAALGRWGLEEKINSLHPEGIDGFLREDGRLVEEWDRRHEAGF